MVAAERLGAFSLMPDLWMVEFTFQGKG